MTADEPPRPDGPLAGRCALVTGGGSGIGRAVCLALHARGADVAVADISLESARETVAVLDEAEGPGAALALAADVRCEESVAAMTSAAVERFGAVDVLVHSAAILRSRGSGPKILPEIESGEMHEVIDTNLKGTFLCNRAVLAGMLERGSGQIVNISSTSGLQGRPMDSVYSASKFGVVGLTESLAEEVRPSGVRVQLVVPDAVATPMWDQNGALPAPPGALPPERVAELIVDLVCLPPDAVLKNVVIAPFRSRRRRKKKASAE
ncbi:MAG: SDR family oxidoreductase [Planctomycetota bacterium]|jgi:NAD(P)-dependent dehydrogenase (short-subunit alcohol dehydrogenase family)|nr:SDR family oxidoreductase [Planctomycetota bacterium]MDP6763129.1 SDR family oxidoreductase [Planctomycetota bacterium]MDP6990288.1 SDR family oxidoreductase [Planctomycetota bacterium]